MQQHIHYLHSTMSLLKRGFDNQGVMNKLKFTFHYVTIKTKSRLLKANPLMIFTFHYVTIKTVFSLPNPPCKEKIYIPLCHY